MRPVLPLLLLTSSALAAPAQRTVDPSASSVRIFVGKEGALKAFGHVHEVVAPIRSGTITVDAAKPEDGSVTLAFSSASLQVDPAVEPAKDLPVVQKEMQDNVLESAKFADVTFKSTSVRIADATAAPSAKRGKNDPPAPPTLEGGRSLVVTGDLKLHGVTLSIAVPVQLVVDDAKVHAVGQVAFQQTDFGITPPSAAGGKVRAKDQLVLTFDVIAR